ncbi:hypothetical protein DE146DRAFT_630158 [Phaeosphaeria sp. MPI-PUGE-AT-0046c]|nr:hypothetical protein DE146DRAFT_630158 [Phaeosphaeria sp. MPI-PUGE-AT-0046c]
MASIIPRAPQSPTTPSLQLTTEQCSSLNKAERSLYSTPKLTAAHALLGFTQEDAAPPKSGSMSQSRPNSRRSSRAGSRQSVSAQAQDNQGIQGAVGVPLDFDNLDFTNDWDLGDLNDYDFKLPDEQALVGDFNQNSPFVFAPPNLDQPAPYGQMLPDFGRNSLSAPYAWDDPALNALIDPALLPQSPLPQSVEPAFHATPGLTAIPGANESESFMPTKGVQDYSLVSAIHMPQMYPDPSAGMYPQAPYFYPPGYQAFAPRYSLQQANTQAQAPVYVPPHKPNKRARDDSDAESDTTPARKRYRAAHQTAVHSESESDSGQGTRAHARKTERRRGSRVSGVSSSSSIGKPNTVAIARIGEKPQKCDDKPWIRVNINTRGETTRTARINGEANELRKYKFKPLPNGDSWESRKFKFEYDEHSNMHEFKVKRMPPRQIFEYIMDYPSDDLKLWIQVSPADSARRYGSPAHSKCLFEQCPKHVHHESGTIEVGHYQVAFDEKFKAHGNKVVDPFDVVGYVHLYCLERFCDFATICQFADIEVDTRVDLPREPRQAKWTMSGRPEAVPAQSFIRACKKGQLRQDGAFKNYPVHRSSKLLKDYEHTVNSAMVDVNVQHRTASQIKQFIDRKLTTSTLLISRGDLELAMTQKKIKRSAAYKQAVREGRAESFDFAAHYDNYDPIINERIAQYKALKEQFQAGTAAGKKSQPPRAKATTSTKRKAIAIDSDDENEDEYPEDVPSDIEELETSRAPVRNGTRFSPRKKARVDYSQVEQPSPRYPPGAAQPQPSNIPHGYLPAHNAGPVLANAPPSRNNSLSHLFPQDQPYNIDDYPLPEGLLGGQAAQLTEEEFDKLMELQRRQSSISTAPRTARKASFNPEPVSDQTVFDTDDPPRMVVQGRRRSVRLAGKA